MEYVDFGKTGLKVSRLGIGSLAVPEEAEGQDEVIRLMGRLLDRGCNLIDTAQCYPRSEEVIGRAFANRREEYVLVSKCGHHDVLPDGSMVSRDISMDDIDQALTKLQTEVIDVMLLHSYDMDKLQSGEALEVLDQAKQAGKIRFAGYSGDNERALYAAEHPLVDVLELSINCCDLWNMQHVLPVARRRGLGVIAKRPLANAAWRYLDDPAAASVHHRPYVDRLGMMNLAPEEMGCSSWGELALRFAMSVSELHCAIASSRSEKNQDANLQAIEQGPLSESAYLRVLSSFEVVSQRETQMDWKSLN